MPLVPGYHGDGAGSETLAASANEIGYPVLIKASAGGGGKGMRVVERADDFAEALARRTREATSAFGDDRVLLEKYLQRPRHIEIQVFADSARQCRSSVRARLLDAAPPSEGDRRGAGPGHDARLRRKEMGEAAVAAARAIGYVGAGTVEFIADRGRCASISWK